MDEITIDATGPDGDTWALFEYTDSVGELDLGAVCPSIFYDRAPDGMSNILGHPNGFFVAFKNNALHFSEPFAPWAWPEDYQIPVNQNIIGLGLFGSTVVVCTDGDILTFSGPHPTAMYKKKGSFQPCLSQRGVVNTDDGVMFPSLEGFQQVSAQGVQNMTADLFKPDDWVDFELDTIHGTWYNKAYYGFYQSDENEGNVVIDLLNGAITTGVDYHQAGHVALLDGLFRTIFPSDIEDPTLLYIAQWDADTTRYRNYSYKSPRFIISKPKNYKVAQVILDTDFYTNLLALIEEDQTLIDLNAVVFASGNLDSTLNGPMLNEQDVNGDALYSLKSLGVQSYVDFKVYVDSVLKFTKQVSTSNMFKLPRGFKNKKWEVVVEGMIPVKRITMATSTEEIV